MGKVIKMDLSRKEIDQVLSEYVKSKMGMDLINTSFQFEYDYHGTAKVIAVELKAEMNL